MTTYQLNNEVSKASRKISKSIIFLLTPKMDIGYLEDHYTVRQSLEIMKHHGYTAMPVISKEGRYVGTVNEGDFLWKLVSKDIYNIHDYENLALRDILREDWNPAITVNVTVEEVSERILDQNFLPVVDDRYTFMGIITRKSVLQYYRDTV